MNHLVKSWAILSMTAALGVCCAHSPAGPSADRAPHPLAAYYPLAVGNCWTYATSFQGQPQADMRVCIVRQEKGFFLDDRPRPSRLRLDAGGLRDGAVRYLLKAPLHKGAKWMSVADVRTVEHYEIAEVNRQVSVPAGSFKGCVVVRQRVHMKDNLSMATTWTYAPDVGIVEIRSDLLVGAKVAPQARLRLKKFEQGSPAGEPATRDTAGEGPTSPDRTRPGG
jgi:hypothetical protein